MTTTIDRYLKLATPLGAADPLRADQPLGAGVVQIIASNATSVCRQDSMRTLWEHPGGDVWADLAIPGLVETFRWQNTLALGTLACFAGLHTVRFYGERSVLPSLTVRARVSSATAATTGVVMLVRPSYGDPSVTYGSATDTTTSTSPTTIKATLQLLQSMTGERSLSPSPGSSTPATEPTESGDVREVAVFVGFWCTSNSSGNKAAVHSLTLSLFDPQ